MGRREALWGAGPTAVGLVVGVAEGWAVEGTQGKAPGAASGRTLRVGAPGRATSPPGGVEGGGGGAALLYGSIAEALAAARDGDLVLLEGGATYSERVVLDKAVTLRGAGAESTVVSHATSAPYEATVTLAASGARLEGIQVLHASKSVAGNYACYVADGCDVAIEDCVVSSRTGGGVGSEGGSPEIRETRIRDCKNNGIFLTSDLGETRGGGRVTHCVVSGCGLDGIALRRTFGAAISDTRVSDARGFGVSVRFCDADTRVDQATVACEACSKGAFVYEDASGTSAKPFV